MRVELSFQEVFSLCIFAGSLLQFHCRRLEIVYFRDSVKQRSAMRCTVMLTWHRYPYKPLRVSRWAHRYPLGGKKLCVSCFVYELE